MLTLPKYCYADSPLGRLLLTADDLGLTGLWFEGERAFQKVAKEEKKEEDLPIFQETRRWLTIYFSGQNPSIMPPIHLIGTLFQLEVWQLLRTIPYGHTVTYGDLAKRLAAKRGTAVLAAQAVGGAVGKNPISILVPCHRVIGANGTLTGYAGGIERKFRLLTGEGIPADSLTFPKQIHRKADLT